MRPTATRPDAIRSHNLRVVLGELHRRGALTRAQLTQDLGLNRSTIGALVAELAEYGLVSESSPQTRRGAGRPSHVVGPRPDGPYALAVDVDVHELVVAAIGLGGDMLARWTCAYPAERVSPEYVVDRIGEAHLAISAGPAGRGWVAGLGVSVPGTVRRADGRILVAPNLGWRDVTLAHLITTRMACAWPIVTANDADLGALSEHLRGSARGIEDVLFIAGRVGVGGGVIAGGMPLHGASGLAGEIGHIVVDPSGPHCHCGNRGCLETFVGESAFMRLSGRAHVAGVDGVAEVVRLAGEGDARAAETVAYVCEWLGRGLASLANILNPAVIVIGGYLTSLLEAHHDLIRASFDANMRAAPGNEIDIRSPGLGRDSALYGAAEVGFSALLDDPVETASRFGYARTRVVN